MIEAGQRVFLEKPLTGTLQGDRDFAALLEREHPQALMLGFQRRFDAPTLFAKQLIDQRHNRPRLQNLLGARGLRSGSEWFFQPRHSADMAVHNVDEVVWLSGRKPRLAMAVGSRIYQPSAHHLPGRLRRRAHAARFW